MREPDPYQTPEVRAFMRPLYPRPRTEGAGWRRRVRDHDKRGAALASVKRTQDSERYQYRAPRRSQ